MDPKTGYNSPGAPYGAPGAAPPGAPTYDFASGDPNATIRQISGGLRIDDDEDPVNDRPAPSAPPAPVEWLPAPAGGAPGAVAVKLDPSAAAPFAPPPAAATAPLAQPALAPPASGGLADGSSIPLLSGASVVVLPPGGGAAVFASAPAWPSAPPAVLPRDDRIDVSGAHWHWRSLVTSVLLWGLAGASVWAAATRQHGGAPVGIYVAAGISALLYLIEVCCSDTLRFLRNAQTCDSADDYARRLYVTPPTVRQWVQFYHWETRTHTRTVRNADGSSRTEFHTERVRVNTYHEAQNFAFQLWRDASLPFPAVRYYGAVTKLHCGKSLAFADDFSRARFDQSMTSLIARNRWRDMHYDSGWKLEVPGFQSHLLAFNDPRQRTSAMSSGVFTIASLAGLTWPYRLWLERRCIRAQYRFVKEVRCVV